MGGREVHLALELEQQREQQVRHHDRRARAIAVLCDRFKRARADVEAAYLHRHAVGGGVQSRCIHAVAVVVEADNRREAKPCGRDREHSRSGADIQERSARSGRGQSEQQLQAELRARVRAGAEGLTGIDHDVLDAIRVRAAGHLPRGSYAQRNGRDPSAFLSA